MFTQPGEPKTFYTPRPQSTAKGEAAGPPCAKNEPPRRNAAWFAPRRILPCFTTPI